METHTDSIETPLGRVVISPRLHIPAGLQPQTARIRVAVQAYLRTRENLLVPAGLRLCDFSLENWAEAMCKDGAPAGQKVWSAAVRLLRLVARLSDDRSVNGLYYRHRDAGNSLRRGHAVAWSMTGTEKTVAHLDRVLEKF